MEFLQESLGSLPPFSLHSRPPLPLPWSSNVFTCGCEAPGRPGEDREAEDTPGQLLRIVPCAQGPSRVKHLSGFPEVMAWGWWGEERAMSDSGKVAPLQGCTAQTSLWSWAPFEKWELPWEGPGREINPCSSLPSESQRSTSIHSASIYPEPLRIGGCLSNRHAERALRDWPGWWTHFTDRKTEAHTCDISIQVHSFIRLTITGTTLGA